MTFAAVAEFALKYWKWIGLGAIVLAISLYIGFLKHTITSDHKVIGAKDQQIADLKAGITVQNLAMKQLEQYSADKDRQVADATALAEKMQDTVDTQANEIMLRKTNIEQQIVTLSDCQAEIYRIKDFMIDAEKEIKEIK